MAINTLFIQAPGDWECLSRSLMALSAGKASAVTMVNEVEHCSIDPSEIDVVVMKLSGQADYALEIYGKDVLQLPDDTVGMHVSASLQRPVLIPDDSLAPGAWLRLSPDGLIETIALDIDSLDASSIVKYTMTEQGVADQRPARRESKAP